MGEREMGTMGEMGTMSEELQVAEWLRLRVVAIGRMELLWNSW